MASQPTCITLKVELIMLRRRIAAWLAPEGRTGRAKLSVGRLALATLAICTFIVWRFAVFVTVITLLSLAGVDPSVAYAVTCGVVLALAAQSTFADFTRVSDRVFGRLRPETDFLLSDIADVAAANARAILYLAPTAVAGLVTFAASSVAWQLLMGDSGTPVVGLALFAATSSILALALKCLALAFVGPGLSRPDCDARLDGELWLRLLVTVGQALLVGLLVALAVASGVRTFSAALTADHLASVERWQNLMQLVKVQASAIAGPVRALMSVPILLLLVSGACVLLIVAERMLARSIAGELARRRARRARTPMRVRADGLQFSRGGWTLLQIGSGAHTLKDLRIMWRTPELLRRAVRTAILVHAFTLGIALGLGDVVPLDLAVFYAVTLATCVSASAISRSLQPVFACDAEGRNVDLHRLCGTPADDLLRGKCTGLAVVVAGVNASAGLLVTRCLGAGLACTITSILTAMALSAATAAVAVASTAVFPRFDWRQPHEAGATPGALLLGQGVQQTYMIAALTVTLAPLVDPIALGVGLDYPWLSIITLESALALIVASAATALSGDRLARFLEAR